MPAREPDYITALSHDWLTPLYDTVIRWTMPETRFKRQLVTQARIKSDDRILDLGCGTATLSILIKTVHPNAQVFGADGDAKILEIAKRKTIKAELEITFAKAMAFNLPRPNASFNRTEYVLLSTELGGEKRFSSTIARRLGSLGGLTKGDRGAADSCDLAKYNFETEEGRAALCLMRRIVEGRNVHDS